MIYLLDFLVSIWYYSFFVELYAALIALTVLGILLYKLTGRRRFK